MKYDIENMTHAHRVVEVLIQKATGSAVLLLTATFQTKPLLVLKCKKQIF